MATRPTQAVEINKPFSARGVGEGSRGGGVVLGGHKSASDETACAFVS